VRSSETPRRSAPKAQRSRLRGTTWLALCIAACSASDSHVGCSPSLTCSLNDQNFQPPAVVDAGAPPCDPSVSRCHATRIASGGAHSCAVTRARELFCWGSDGEHQLGITGVDEDAGGGAADAGPSLQDVVEVAAGGAHTCVITRDQSVLCWGRDAEGQVDGIARPEPIAEPQRLALGPASGLDAGDAHSCAVVEGGVACWGSARYGQVGRSVMDGVLPPDVVPGTEGAVEVATGMRHSCARLASGKVVCWGELIDKDSLLPQPSADAIEVEGLSNATAITAGAGQSCALRADAVVVCWGQNGSGQLGDGSLEPSAVPVVVQGLDKVLYISAGGGLQDGVLVGHSCAVDKGFFVQCWGRNHEGQLGIGEADDSRKPMTVLGPIDESDTPFLDSITKLSAGGFHTCALDDSGRALCWGDDSASQLGSRTPPRAVGRPVRVARFSRFR
jgi:Regulator of chromosome condensation (RCC1) repeat